MRFVLTDLLGERTGGEFAIEYAVSRVLNVTQPSRRLTQALAQKYWSDQSDHRCATLTFFRVQKIGQPGRERQ